MEPNVEEAERRIAEARETGAEWLDLGDLHLRKLPGSLGELAQLKQLDLGGRLSTETGIEGLEPLAQLQELRSLNLSFCRGITDLGPLAKLNSLKQLNLSKVNLKNLDFLAKLQRLQSLNLSYCSEISNLTPLREIKSLQKLILSSTPVTDLQPLKNLGNLRSLNLSFCPGVKDLKFLGDLPELRRINLWHTGIQSIEPLAGSRKLHSLNLSSTKISNLDALAYLQELQDLNLSSTDVIDLAPLFGLKKLTILFLSSTRVENLAPLAGLHELRALNLWGTRITDLGPLADLRKLQALDVSFCSLDTRLTALTRLRRLKTISLRSCQGVTDLQGLASLQELQQLDLYGYRPVVSAATIHRLIKIPSLHELNADEVMGLPREILSRHPSDNCLQRLRSYFSDLASGPEPENEVKVILLGNGRVGKTQLCRSFRGEPFDSSVQSTHGVQIWREELKIQTAGQETAFQVNWWDFGGQDIYHGTHALFLRNRAVLLILWNPSFEDRKEFPENGLVLRNQPLAYWLDYVRSLTGKDSPVIVVQSQCDTFADRRPAPQRPEGFGFFESGSFSARTDLGRETLEGQLRDAMRYLLERNGALEIGQGRAEVRRRLYAWRSEDQERKSEERGHRTLTLEAFRALCDEVGGISSWEHALDYFHQTGVVFYQSDLFADRIILDQDWALDAIYAVFHRGKTMPWLRDSGRFTREDLAATVWQDHSPEEQRLFLGLMESCGVCFACGETAKGESRYVAPDLLPKFASVAGRLQAWKEEAETPALRLEYRFFHPAVIRNLMSKVGQKAGDLAEYWKYGLWFKDGQRDTQLLAQFEDTSTDKEPGAGALVLKAQGRDPQGLLREIRRAILRRRIGEKPDELLTLDGVTVARSALTSIMDGRVHDCAKRPVEATAFAAFFEDRRQDQDEDRTAESPTIKITPSALTEKEKPLSEVFISYAWGDPTPEGMIRTKAVDGLTAALEKDGFLPIRDLDQMHPGELISAFIRRLTRADHAVAIISDKYLRSPYCMFEIYKLWQKSQTEAEDMAQRVVPIVLPEVKIGSFAERRPYLKHWAEQAKDLEALVRDPEISPGGASWQEFRLVREFAHHIDDILVFLNDVLMPRQLEVHLDNEFEAVRDALRRRLAKND